MSATTSHLARRELKRRVRVVIAHADPEILHDLEVGLMNNGFSVSSADNGIACMAKLELLTPDILLIDADLMWGGYDGVLEVMEGCERLTTTQTILLTDNRKREKPALRDFTVCDVMVLPLSIDAISARCVELTEASLFFDHLKSVRPPKSDGEIKETTDRDQVAQDSN